MSERTAPRLGTLLRLAGTGSRVDGIRIGLSVLGAAASSFVLMLVAAVISIGPQSGPYRLEVLQQPGLRPGVVAVLLLLCVPILSFVAQCSRIGAPQRDRRLAALRMAGGTPSDVRRVVALETGVAAALGSAVGGVGYLIAHLLSGPSQGLPPQHLENGAIVFDTASAPRHTYPTDVIPHTWLIVLALLIVPVAATLGAVLALRRTAITPFGVIRRTVHRPPTVLPTVLFLVGAIGLAAWQGLFSLLPDSTQQSTWALPLFSLLFFIMAAVGLTFGSASAAYLLGRVIAERTRRPALLIAARRMVDAPFTASRSTTAVVVAVLLGAAVQGVRSNFLLMTSDYDDPFYANTFDLLDVVLVLAVCLASAGLLVVAAEGIVTRRRTLAALSATGAPHRTLAASTLLEMLIPLVPATVVATIVGVLAARGVFGTSVAAGASDKLTAVPVPWGPLGILLVGTVLVATAVTAVSLAFLPRSTSITELRAAA